LFLSNTQYTWDRFLSFQPQLAAVRHAVVPLGIGTPLVGRAPDPHATPAALILGRMARTEDYKGHRELIAAWPRVRDRVPGAELLVAGDGDLRPDLEALAGQTCPGAVRFQGRVSEAQKQDLLARARCLAMPSRGEGFGLVYLEAMRVGRPCLVSDQDAGREVVVPPEAGLAANPADPAALAAAVADLIAPGVRWDDWSRAARARYEASFTAAHFGRRLLGALAAHAAKDAP
jgi:phosphatidylinositol alpha-1,6-mannosyltransferase